MDHLCCSEVSISPLFRWPNSVNHFTDWQLIHRPRTEMDRKRVSHCCYRERSVSAGIRRL
ncbi:TPA: hypothetical protein HNC63_07150 [Escherichia fergusonii]|nr:hypothetical protein [Escherichia fergusonii]HAJ6560605.1 hypothetical protein [Escherichia fergusonii]HAJ6568444.1 hypothetical protein [Escherichia fergusonii]